LTTVGLCLPQLGPHIDRSALRTFCERAEALGFASLWVQEHLFYPLAPRSGYSAIAGQPIPDPYRSTLAATELLMAAAAWTDRVDLGTSVLVAGYHRPLELAKRLATIDVLSGGRLIAGFSVGWSDDEHEQMNVDPRTRGRRCEELIDALIACWGPDPVRFDGEFFHIPPSIVAPKPLHRPRLLSGMRSERGLQHTARVFDIWNPSRGSAAEVASIAAGLRPSTVAALDVYQRVFLEPSVPPEGVEPPGVAGVAAAVHEARAAGLAAVIIEANFWREIRSPADWAALPDQLAEAVLP
jgi:probable F420-dependent oxidoreductase